MSAAAPAMEHPIRSMTGFATAEGTLADDTTFTLTLKSVNHRFLDLHLRLPAGSHALEQQLRRTVKDSIARGHVELTLELAPTPAADNLHLNEELLATLIGQLQAVARRHQLSPALDVAALLRAPGVLVHEARQPRATAEDLLERVPPVLARALAALQRTREIEGAELVREMHAAMARLHAHLAEVRQLRGGVRQAQFERLRDRLRALLEDTASEDRLLTEAAVLADRSDIEEEMVRLETHIDRFLALLAAGGAVGKQLDFLLQEFNRETNTVLSKSGSAAGPDGARLVALGLEMKTEIERTREQVQNLE